MAQALDDGDDWIYVGFGSMEQDDPDELLSRVGEACERVGVRAVVQLGQVRGSPHPRLLCIGEEPHDELFGRTRAVVHHGGAGTTGAAVRSGVPSVVVPHFADQFYWGSRLHALGVAARPVPRAFASAGSLARLVEDGWVDVLFAGNGFATTAAEYVVEESRDVVPRAELEAFHDDVDGLNDDVERLSARIGRLARGAGA